MNRRDLFKRGLALGAGLALPELIVPEKRFWQGVSLAKAREPILRAGDHITIDIIGPAPDAIWSQPSVARLEGLKGGAPVELYDYFMIDREVLWVRGFDTTGNPLIRRWTAEGFRDTTLRVDWSKTR